MTDLSSLIADIARNEIPDNVWEVARSLRNVVNWQSNGSIENIAKVLIAFSKRDQWQPIETAPKDGTRILLVGGVFHDIPFAGYWNFSPYAPDRPWTTVVGRLTLYEHCPTHWMPLPSPPRTKEGESNG
ncbi:hypothetical protein [Shinella zoogloeoides]